MSKNKYPHIQPLLSAEDINEPGKYFLFGFADDKDVGINITQLFRIKCAKIILNKNELFVENPYFKEYSPQPIEHYKSNSSMVIYFVKQTAYYKNKFKINKATKDFLENQIIIKNIIE